MATKGRPRSFDRDAVLDAALTEFWRHGYEATSLSGLTKAMGINPPSLYAAFGDKRQLFTAAVQRYAATHGSYSARALARPTAREAVETMLGLAAAGYAEPGHPPGCFVVDGATNTTDAAQDVREELRALREGVKQALAARITADAAAGLLPPVTRDEADGLAAFYASVIQGMSTQARDGADRATLERIAALAMRAWPSAAAETAETASAEGGCGDGGGRGAQGRTATAP
ncbi:TetR/AcrR family transcriptional regulator [Kitasatospora sp. YST-16]|uniref:TetR/AcrR family transcriptional regulator n=1 Tax=Kitasatospora sp. YST-16 TaxID=2998080 RepID=UPI002284967F|nr:TetR/AcrR family transcriptional regulator [Kitasatospora sp. YST-16]WAL75908.1 TetR/AcrR family transcriptional regulator [Kitasatospora sp. YST-16]WNW41969.1 TetR/AcrR family transcriptional regulator [Streptomyces sp. Li-HN-5-13]